MLLDYWPQCCDSLTYLDMGRMCGMDNQCWHPYRPMGTLYWFAISHWLGLPAQAMIWIHLGMLLLSVSLATKALAPVIVLEQRWKQALLFALILGLHAVFFYPVIFHSLADAPSSLFLLIACWLSIIAGRKSCPVTMMLMGVCLGMAAWIRAFYLYPLLVGLVVFLLCWVFDRQRKPTALLVLVALLPLAYQYHSTHEHTGHYSFLDDKSTEYWTGSHLYDRITAYDTLMPNSFHYLQSPCSLEMGGIMGAIEKRDPVGLLCIMKDRSHFYLGSYAPATYLEDKHQRLWLWSFLLANLLSIVLALVFLWQRRALLGKSFVATFTVVAMGYGEALILVPEQRFVIVSEVLAIALAIAAIFCFLGADKNSPGKALLRGNQRR